MIAFLTQYYRGLGHSQRTKFIAEEVGKKHDVLIIDQLFKPPLSYSVPHTSFLKDYKPNDLNNMFQFIMSDDMINFRIRRFIEILYQNKISVLICEGFPFCRQQFAHEYIRYFEECKKRGIKIIISIRDFPWDEPHDTSLQDWVNYTQNIVCKHYVEKVLVHGDPNILPLISDRTNHSNSKQIIDDILPLVEYTGYVCDDTMGPHLRINNKIYVSTGLNKEEGMLLFKNLLQIAKSFPHYDFVMTVANRYLTTKNKSKGNVHMVEYIPNLRERLINCAAYITYGGYNATVEILKSGIPSIIIPRQDGAKMEQFVRAYTFEPYNFFKVVNSQEIHRLKGVLEEVLKTKPEAFNFNLNGVKGSADVIEKIYSR